MIKNHALLWLPLTPASIALVNNATMHYDIAQIKQGQITELHHIKDIDLDLAEFIHNAKVPYVEKPQFLKLKELVKHYKYIVLPQNILLAIECFFLLSADGIGFVIDSIEHSSNKLTLVGIPSVVKYASLADVQQIIANSFQVENA